MTIRIPFDTTENKDLMKGKRGVRRGRKRLKRKERKGTK